MELTEVTFTTGVASRARVGTHLGYFVTLIPSNLNEPWQRIARQRITQTFFPESVISFTTLGEEDETKGPMIIEAEMGGHCLHCMYVNGGSSLEILYEHCFSRFRPKIKNQLIPANTPLVGFSGEIIWPLGQISLLVRIGDEEHLTSAWMNFMVVRSPSSYNGIIGRPGRKEEELCGLLRRHPDAFARKPADMTGVPRHVAERRLIVPEGCLPVRQKKRGQAPERNKAIGEEVKKLVEADIMKEVHYHNWLSNPVMVKKHDGSWRMVWFDDLPKESIDSYNDLRKAFLENYLQQKKCIKGPIEIHNIKQRDGESTEEFVRRYKLECRDVKGAPKCMKISRFMHEEVVSVLETAGSRAKAKFREGKLPERTKDETKTSHIHPSYKNTKRNSSLIQGEVKLPPSMTTPVEKRNASKFCEFHGEVGHTTDECMHLMRQIEEMIKAIKLSHLIKELKQNHRKDQAKTAKKRETSGKVKSLAILMVQPRQRIARQRITQTFSSESVISFPTLGEEDETEGPMIIKVEIGGHYLHRMYVDGGSSSKILYEHCFSRFRLEIKNQLIPANTPLVRFSGEIIWPLEQISLLVRIGDEEHSTSAWMNLMLVRSPSPYNRITGRPEKPADLTGVPRHVAEHRLDVREGCLPVRQKKRGQAPERNKAIGKEVKKLENVRGFQGLKQSIPKDGYLLMEMIEEDEEKTAFITSQGIFCYSKMPFGLKNARATYQRLVDKAFQKQIGRNLEVYVDNLVIKSRTEKEVIRDIEETFKTLKEINMKLNPKKCAFGMKEGTFLGYKVDADGLRVCPDKVEVVLNLPSPKCLKDIQKLNGKLASLNEFLSKSAEKSLPFFKTLENQQKRSKQLGDKEKNVSAHSRDSGQKSYYSSRRDTESCYQSSRPKETKIVSEKHCHKIEYSRRTEAVSENHFTPRIRYFDFQKARMPSHIKTYDRSEDPEDHLKIFQAAAKTERWAIPTWYHLFNSTLTENAMVWFDDLPKESIDSYDDLRKAFLENYLQQKKCIKDPVEIHTIKQRDKESTEEFVRRYKLKCKDVRGAPECMKISRFMHEITNPELIKQLHDKILKSMDEMMSVTDTL
nr:reverse transcriptase domain-containing protein [Tanacetum cinerariifolium]